MGEVRPERMQISWPAAGGLLVVCWFASDACWSALAQDSVSQRPGEVDWLKLTMGGLAGLVLFLFGVSLLSHALKQVAGERLKGLLEKAAGHRVRALFTGTVATTLLDSSSATIILLITLVDAGALSFANALPVILGSNVGTTVSSRVFALNIDEYAPVLLLAGFLWRSLAKSDLTKAWGTVVLGIGLVLFGLHTISECGKQGSKWHRGDLYKAGRSPL